MKKFKILSALLSAVTAISALSVYAGATCIPEGYEPTFDLTPTIEGSIKREEIKSGENLFYVYSYYYDTDGNKVTGKSLIYIDRSNADELGSGMTMFRADKETGRLMGAYTGFAKNKKGRSYYNMGKRIYGWYKVGNNWYHFDENGYADTGRVKISGSYYTFDKKGKWTGKVSKKGLAPKDFYIEYSCIYESFDSDGLIVYGADTEKDYPDAKVTKQVKMSAQDRQIFYAMFLESDFETGKDYVFDDEAFSERMKSYKTEGDFTMFGSEPGYSYDVEVSYGGKKTKISFFYDSVQLIHLEKDFLAAYRLTQNIHGYLYNFLYKKYPRPDGVEWAGID